MAHTIDLTVEPRTVTGKKVKVLRREGKIPGNVYGHGMDSTAVQVDVKTLEDALRHTSSTTLVNLRVGAGRARPVFIRGVRWALLRRVPEHVDFFAVRMDEKMRATVSIVTRGDSPIAKSSDLMLQHAMTQIQVEGLPGALPEAIAVDVSHLSEVDQAIHARDLPLPEGVSLVGDPDELIVRVAMTRAAMEPVTSGEGTAEAAGAGAESGPQGGSGESAAGGQAS